MILFHTLVSSPGWQVLAASKLAAYRVVTGAVNVNLTLIFMFASSLELRTPASGADRPRLASVVYSILRQLGSGWLSRHQQGKGWR